MTELLPDWPPGTFETDAGEIARFAHVTDDQIKKTTPEPRRAKPRRDWGTDFFLVTCCFISGFVGGFLGTVFGSIW